MPKGKKFDAAKKHFSELETELRNKYRGIEAHARVLISENEELKKKLSTAEGENEQLRLWVERLLEYTELNKEDIKAACQRDKKAKELVDLVNLMRSGQLFGVLGF